jgi:DNA-binding transcriptional MerR regulator
MHRPKEVAEQFGVTTATLRLWSTHFEDYLSPAAQRAMTENGGAALLATGLTYEEVKQRLGDTANESATGDAGQEAGAPSTSVVARDESASSIDVTFPEPARLVIAALQDSLRAKEETLSSRQETIAALTTTVGVLQEQIAGLREDLAERRATADGSPWWKRWFGWANPQMDPT